MNLDINTDKGRQSLWDEIEAIEILKRHFPHMRYLHTDKEGPAAVDAVDAVVAIHERLRGVAETKCRDMTLMKLQTQFENKWLITWEKLTRGATVADLLDVPFYGLLYLTPSKVLLKIKLYEKNRWLARYTVRESETQKTVNGGKIIRENAYVDMANADILR